jgi:hypothetical protein
VDVVVVVVDVVVVVVDVDVPTIVVVVVFATEQLMVGKNKPGANYEVDMNQN